MIGKCQTTVRFTRIFAPGALGAVMIPINPVSTQREMQHILADCEASVIIPVLNRVRTISDAIDSVMTQKCSFDFNLIVVDNHSTDGTTGLLEETAALAREGKLVAALRADEPKGKGLIKGLTHLQKYRDGLACYSTDRQNASDPGVEELAISEEEILPEDIALLYEWSPPQRDALDAISRIFDSRSWLEDIKTPEGMARMVQEGFKDSTVSVLVRRIKNELERNRYIMKRSSLANILANLKKGKVVLVDIPRMTDRSELFLLSVISRYVLDEYKRDLTEGESRKNCLITIEEAQRVLGAGSNTSRFESIAREGRKFGVGLCAITQQPKLIDKQLLSQFNTLVVMGLGDRNDRHQLEESAKQDLSSLDIEIQTLEKGEAVVSTLSIPFPVPARIHRYEDYLRRLEKEEPERMARKGGFKPFLE